jgi:hypothetical protein
VETYSSPLVLYSFPGGRLLASAHSLRAHRDCRDFCGDSPYKRTNFDATRNNSPQLATFLTYQALQGFLPSNQHLVEFAQDQLLITRLR